jgi:hypothetical protein
MSVHLTIEIPGGHRISLSTHQARALIEQLQVRLAEIGPVSPVCGVTVGDLRICDLEPGHLGLHRDSSGMWYTMAELITACNRSPDLAAQATLVPIRNGVAPLECP